MLTRNSMAHISRTALAMTFLAGVSVASAQNPTSQAVLAQSVPTQDEAIRGIDAAVAHRTKLVSAYNVQELYTIYRNNAPDPSVQVTVKTVYNRATGKDYTTLSVTGSTLLRANVVDRVIANEKEMAKASNRESVAITSANYEMTLLPGIVPQNGHNCIQIELKARRKMPYLFNGKAWFDASDFTLVHIEGTPAASASFWAGATSGARDYTKVDGFSMAQHAELHSHSFLFGDTLMRIDYSDYQIQTDPTSAAVVNLPKSAR
jgi:hypothetical protein